MANQPPSYVGQPVAIPGKMVVQSLPTPNLQDRIFVLRKDSRLADYKLPEKGSAYTGPEAEKFEGFIFCTAKPVDQIGWVDWFYLNERANENAYNFTVEFPYADREYPRYTRTYVVLRDDTRANEPQADSVDPIHSDLLLTDHKWLRFEQDPILDALFIGVSRTYERLPSPVIRTYDLNAPQQVVTVDTQEVQTESVPTPNALTEIAKVERSTTAKARVTFGTVGEVFPDTRYVVAREDSVIPLKFRVAVPSFLTSQIIAGTVAVPVLGAFDWLAEQHQITKYKKLVATTSRVLSGVVTLIDYKLTADQQLSTITDTWSDTTQTLTPTALMIEGEVDNLGDGQTVKTVTTVPDVFPHGIYEIEVPDPVPERFRVAIPLESTTTTSIGTADTTPSLGTGELSRKEEQATEFWKRVSTRGRSAVSLPVSLIAYKRTAQGQIETITETLDAGLQTLSLDELTVEAEVQNLGNSTSLLMVGTVPAVFGEELFKTEIPDPIPERFRVAAPTSTESEVVAGTATAPTLGTGDLSATEEQITEQKKRVTSVNRSAVTLPVTLVSYKLTGKSQIETVTETLDTGLQTLGSVDELVEEAEVQNLGNNTSLKTMGVVSALFGGERFAKEIPDAVPERFRVAVPVSTTEDTIAGTAAMPTLGTGDLEASETQLTAFAKRTTLRSRAGITLPVSLVSYRMGRDAQVETITETLDTGLQTLTLTTLTSEANVQNLGNNTSLKFVAASPAVFGEARFSKRIPDPIPERFRVVAPVSVTSSVITGTAVAPTLGTGDLSAEEEQLTAFHKRTTLETRAAVTLPVSLTSYKLTKDGQVETVVETLDAGLQTIPTPDELTVDADVQNLGNNTSLLSVGTVPALFGRERFSTEIPDPIPERFRVAAPVSETEADVAGTAAAPTLGIGELAKSETQTTEFVKRTSTRSRATVTLPVSLTGYKMTREGQVETLIETLDTGLQTIAPDEFTVETESQNLGNGTSLLSVGTVPAVFGKEEFVIEIPDAIPERFRVAVPVSTTEAETAGTATAPTLGTGDLRIAETQVTEFVKRTSTRSRASITLPVSLTSYRVDKDQQLETIVETLDTGIQTITPSSLITEANVQNLGNGTSLKLQASVAAVFGEARYAVRIPDPIPERFRVVAPVSSTSVITTGTAAAPTLGTGDLSATQEQVTAFHKRTTTESRAAVTLPVSLTSYKLTREGQVETVVETLDTGLQTIPTPDELTTEADVQNLGNNTSLLSVGTVPALFGRSEFIKEIPDAIPERFRVAAPVSTVEEDIAGTAAAPTLSTGDLRISEIQVTEFVKRTSTRTRAAVTLPVSLTSYRLSRDQVLETVVETLDTGLQTITPATLQTEASVQNLGNNTSLKLVATCATLFGEETFLKRIPDPIPERFRVVAPVSRTSSITTGTAATPTLGTGDLSKSEEQVTAFHKRSTIETRAAVTLPVSLTSYKLTREGQIETVIETLDTGLQTIPTPDELTVEADVQNLGNNTSLLSVGTVPALFGKEIFVREIPDAVPERFRVAVPVDTTEVEAAGTAAAPTLGTGDLRIEETQVTEFVKRTSTRSRSAVTLPVTLTSYRLSRDQQLETVLETLDTGLQTVTPANLLVEANVQDLGNSTSLKLEATVPSLFAEQLYAKHIPDAVPERFRVAVPVSRSSQVVAGTAAAPTLGTGDLSAEEQQLTVFHKRTSLETRASITLPVSLTSYKMTREGQVETLVETLDTGLQTIAPDEFTVETESQNLGNGTSLRSIGTVPAVFGRSEFIKEIPDPIPERFRVAAPVSTTETEIAGTAAAPTLGTGDLRKAETQVTEFVKRTSTRTRAAVTLPVSLTSYRLDRDQQLETIVETLDTGLQTITPSTLISEANVQNLGNGTSLKLQATVPAVFGENRYSKKIPDPIPERFRVVAPVSTISAVTTGTAAAPTLGTGDLSATEEQVSAFHKRSTIETRASVTLPVSLTSYKLTREGQVETVVETLDTGLQTIPTPDELTVDADVQNLGNNTSLLSVGTVSALFGREEFVIEIPDAVPERFRVAVPVSTTAVDTAGIAAAPTLGTGDLRIDETQVTEFVKRTSTRSRSAVTLPVSLTGYRLNREQQLETIVETLDAGLQTITPSTLQTEASVQDLGNSTSLKSIATVAAVFSENTFSKRIPDPIPERFRVVAPVSRTSSVTTGTAAAPTLGTGDLFKSDEQITDFHKRSTTETRASVTLPVSLTSYKLTKEGQIETVVETLDTGLQTIPTPDELTVDADVQNLGNNTSLLSVGTVPALFGREAFSKEIPDPIPERFRVAAPASTTEVDVAGTAAMPTLGTGDLRKAETQVSEFVKRTSTHTRASVTLPVSLTSYRMSRDQQVETIVETLDTGLQTITPVSTTSEASVQNLGNSTSLKLIASVPAVFGETKYATRIPDSVPERFRVAVPVETFSEVTAGTAAAPTLGTGDLAIEESQLTAFHKRTTTESRGSVSLPVSLTSYKLTGKKQVETLVETLDTGLQTITPTGLTIEANVDNLGNGTSLLTQGTVGALFTQASYSIEIPVTIPERFRPAVPITTTSLDSIGTAAAPTLGTGEFQHSDEQVDAYVKRTQIKSIGSVSLPVSMIHYRYEKATGRVETITETLATGLQTLSAITALTTEADVQNLGNGTSLKKEATVASLFLRKSSSKEIEDIIPREFRGIVPIYTTEQDVAGTIVDPPALGIGDLQVTEAQLNDYIKRVTRRTRDPSLTLPVTLTGGKKIVEKFGIQLLADRVVTLGATGSLTIPTGQQVIEAEINEVGNGLEVATSLVASGGVWPVLHSLLYDEEMKVLYPEDRQIVDPTFPVTIPDPTSTSLVELKAIDQWHSWKITTHKFPTANSRANANVSDIMMPFTFPGRFDHGIATRFGGVAASRAPHSSLVRVTQYQWWEISPTKPIVTFDEIKTTDALWWDSSSQARPDNYKNVLCDTYSLFLYTGYITVQASTPSLTEYYGGGGFLPASITWTTGSSSVVGINTNFTQTFGVLLANNPNSIISAPNGDTWRFNVVSDTIIQLLGSSSANIYPGYLFNTATYSVPPYTGPTTTVPSISNIPVPPGTTPTGWVGTSRVIAASVEPDKLPNLWRITTKEVVMR